MSQPLSDQQLKFLFEQSRRGDKHSYLKLIKSYVPDVYRVIIQIHPDKKEAPKIIAEVFAAAWEHLSQVKTPEQLPQWLIEIAAAIAVSYKPASGQDAHRSMFAAATQTAEFTPLEKELWKLDPEVRKALFLFARFTLSLEKISKILHDETVSSLRAKLGAVMSKAAAALNCDKLVPLSENDFETLIEVDNKNTRLPLRGKDEDKEIYEQYGAVVSEITHSFKNFSPPQEVEEHIRAAVKESKHTADIQAKPAKHKDGGTAKKHAPALAHLQLFSDRSRKTNTAPVLRVAAAAMGFVMLAVAGYFIYAAYFKTNTPWLLENSRGVVTCSGSSTVEMDAGNTVTTGPDGTVSVVIPGCGFFHLRENTTLKLETGMPKKNAAELLSGYLAFISSTIPPAPESFPVENTITLKTIYGTIATKYSDFELSSDSGTVLLTVNDGWADVLNSQGLYHLKKGYVLNMSNANSLPCRADAAPSLQLICNTPDSLSARLSDALAASTREDMLALWHLFPKADAGGRAALLACVENLLPPMTASVREGVMRLKQNEMNFLLGLAASN